MASIVCKFGGSSLSNSAQFKMVKEIIEENPKRKIIVPSAPGKQNPDETKITDLLYKCHACAKKNEDFSDPFSLIRLKYTGIESDLNINCQISSHLDKLEEDLKSGVSEDYIASRGEYLCGLMMASYLDAEFIEPADHIQIDREGRIHPDSYKNLAKIMSDSQKRYILPGFYGADANKEVLTFSRGGSDISGAIAAKAVKAELYENWTDVSGLLMADPRIVENAKTMKVVTYREIRELAYMGANVFHDEAIAPVRDVKIPINIKNTNHPKDAGTLIVDKLQEESETIAGIAGKRDVSLFFIEKAMMNKETGIGRKILGIFEKHGVSYEHTPTGIDTMNVVVLQEELKDKSDDICADLQKEIEPDQVSVNHDISLITTVGERMHQVIGTAAKLFTALSQAKINVAIIDQGFSEINIIVGVFKDDYEKAVRVLYSAFID